MLFSRGTVSIHVRLFGGLAQDAGLKDYDPDKGMTLRVPRGTRIGKVAKKLRLPERHALAYFLDGEMVTLRRKLNESCEIVCLRPSAGG